MIQTSQKLQPGARVEVVQQIPQRDEVWTNRVAGTVVRYEQAKTGSWYAHAKDERLWLDRLTLRAEDGELIILSLDKYTHVNVLAGTDDVSKTQSAPPATLSQVEGEATWDVTGAQPKGAAPGEGVPDTPSGDLGERQDRGD